MLSQYARDEGLYMRGVRPARVSSVRVQLRRNQRSGNSVRNSAIEYSDGTTRNCGLKQIGFIVLFALRVCEFIGEHRGYAVGSKKYLAQWLKHRSHKPTIAGSNPAVLKSYLKPQQVNRSIVLQGRQEKTALKELGKMLSYLSIRKAAKVSENSWQRLFNKNTRLCEELVFRSKGPDICPKAKANGGCNSNGHNVAKSLDI